MPKVDGLTKKQDLFVLAYCSNGFNATDAAAQAKYKGNRNTLHVIGAENLQKPTIAEAIEKRLAKAMESEDYNVELWLKETRLARDKAYKAAKVSGNWSAVQGYDRLLGLYAGSYKADNEQKRAQNLLAVQLQNQEHEQTLIALRNEDAAIEALIKTGKALDKAPDAMAT